jgi:hypothetical protein
MQIRTSQIIVMLGKPADCRDEWAARLPRASPHGEPAPLLAEEARSAP